MALLGMSVKELLRTLMPMPCRMMPGVYVRSIRDNSEIRQFAMVERAGTSFFQSPAIKSMPPRPMPWMRQEWTRWSVPPRAIMKA